MRSSFDWWDAHLTNELYLLTNRQDWWHMCKEIASLLAGGRSILDIGTGDGHTLWQILSFASSLPEYREPSLYIVEPSWTGLERAKKRCKKLPVEQVICYSGGFDKLVRTHRSRFFPMPDKFSRVFGCHVNYYLAKGVDKDRNRKYFETLDTLAAMAETLVLVTAPRESDYYRVVDNPFGDYVYSDVLMEYYRSRGFHVDYKEFPMRFFVDHVNYSIHEAELLWKFFNDTERTPEHHEILEFIGRINEIKDADGNICFRDHVITIRQ